MKQKPFDLKAAKGGAKIMTRSGKPARFIAYVSDASLYRVVAMIDGDEAPDTFMEDGRVYNEEEANDRDLVMAVEMKTVYVNLEQFGYDNCWTAYATEEAARTHGVPKNSTHYIYAVAIPVEIEVKK